MGKRFLYYSSLGAAPSNLYPKCKYFAFDGVNDMIYNINSADYQFIRNSNPFTIEQYLKINNSGSFTYVANQWRPFGTYSWRLLTAHDATSNEFKLRLDLSSNGSSVTQTLITSDTFDYSEIHHIVLALDIANTDYKLYVNGVSYSFTTSVTVTSFSTANQEIELGANLSAGNYKTLDYYYFNLFEAFKSDVEIQAMFSIADNCPTIPSTVNRVMLLDANTAVWDGSDYDSLDGKITSQNMAEAALISC